MEESPDGASHIRVPDDSQEAMGSAVDVEIPPSAVPHTHNEAGNADHLRSTVKRDCGCSKKYGRRLVVCIDGTSNQFGDKNTNVIELYRLIQKKEDDNQLTYYNSGIGTYAQPSSKTLSYYKRTLGHKVDLAIAWNFERIIIGAYHWLSENYRDGDCIFLFGFSRGAYQVRTLSAMIYKVGLIHRGNEAQIPFAYQLYADPNSDTVPETSNRQDPEGYTQLKDRLSPAETFKRTFSRDVKVHFIGAWDTVSSIGVVRARKLLPHTINGMKHTCYFRHALALDERRVKFLPEYVNGGRGPSENPSGGVYTPARPHTKEVWFAGTHSDVGGGNEDNPDLDRTRPSLRWMFAEASAAGLRLDPFKRDFEDEELIEVHESLSQPWKIFEHLPFRRLTYDQNRDTERGVGNGWILFEIPAWTLWTMIEVLFWLLGQLFELFWLVFRIHHILYLLQWIPRATWRLLLSIWRARRIVRLQSIRRAHRRLRQTDWDEIKEGVEELVEVVRDMPGWARSRWCTITSAGQRENGTRSWPPHRGNGRVIQYGQKIHPSVWRLKHLDSAKADARPVYRVFLDATSFCMRRHPQLRPSYIPRAHLPSETMFWEKIKQPKGDDVSAGAANDEWRRWKEEDLYDLVDDLVEKYTRHALVDEDDDEQRTQLAMMRIHANSLDGRRALLNGFIKQLKLEGNIIQDDISCDVLRVLITASNPGPGLGLYENARIWALDHLKEGTRGDGLGSVHFVTELTDCVKRMKDVVEQYTKPGKVKIGTEESAQLRALRVYAMLDRDALVCELSKRLEEDVPTQCDVFRDILDILVESADPDSDVKVDVPYRIVRAQMLRYVFDTDEDQRQLARLLLKRCEEVTRTVQVITGHEAFVSSVVFSPDGKYIASGSWDDTVRIWNAETGAAEKTLKGHDDDVNAVAFSPNGKYVASGSDDMTVRIWDIETGQAVGEPFEGHNDWVQSVAFSTDGKRIVSGSDDRTLRIWDVKTGQSVGKPLKGHTYLVLSVAFSPDGTRVASGSADGTLRIWDAETGQIVGIPLEGHTGWVRSVAFSPDGQHIVSGSGDGTIRIWNVGKGQMVREPLKVDDGSVLSVVFSPNGQHIVSGGGDGTVRIWDVETRQMVGKPYRGHTDPVYSVAFSPDGTHVVSGSGDKTIRIWDVLEPLQPLPSETQEVENAEAGPSHTVIPPDDHSTLQSI